MELARHAKAEFRRRLIVQQNLLHTPENIFIVRPMTATLIFSALFLALSGVLIARLPLRAKLLPLLRRAR
jgi:chromosome condensin MukBEF MukE localization factor